MSKLYLQALLIGLMYALAAYCIIMFAGIIISVVFS